jgi:hypothetical protein
VRRRGGRRLRSLLSSGPLRLVLAAGVLCGLSFVVTNESRSASSRRDPAAGALAERAAVAAERPASRYRRAPIESSPSPTPQTTRATPAVRVSKTTAAPRRKKPAKPSPVAGLTQAQMDNAKIIVDVGRELKLPRKALVIAIATAMQESDLYNLASEALPESLNYPHQGTGADYDSVGLFQQRTSTGWGAVKDLMRPAYAARKFYEALLQVPGWEQMTLSSAAQAVQVSAFPDAYAQHEDRAGTVVDALT